MITPDDCFAYFGDPDRHFEGKWMSFYRHDLEIKCLPRAIYCNEKLIAPLKLSLEEIIARDLSHLVLTWDGCFNVRKMRGSSKFSIHSWGIAFDINAQQNPLGATAKMDPRLVEIFKKNGFDWGGDWKRLDGMHFQLSKL